MVWNSNAQNAFWGFKGGNDRSPILQLPNFSKQFFIQTYASSMGMGVVLTPNDHLVAFFSKSLCPKLQRSYTHVKELHATTSVVQKWQHYLLRRKLFMETAQKSLPK